VKVVLQQQLLAQLPVTCQYCSPSNPSITSLHKQLHAAQLMQALQCCRKIVRARLLLKTPPPLLCCTAWQSSTRSGPAHDVPPLHHNIASASAANLALNAWYPCRAQPEGVHVLLPGMRHIPTICRQQCLSDELGHIHGHLIYLHTHTHR
jgi:hypothetical protein